MTPAPLPDSALSDSALPDGLRPDSVAPLVAAWPHAALVTSREGIVLAINEDAAALLGATVDELAGLPLERLVGVETAASLLVPPASAPLRDGDRDETAIAHSRRAATDEVVVTLSDHTAAGRLSANIDQAERLASIGELLSSVAHELNNPLTSVLGFAEILLADDDPTLPRQELECIREEAQRCRRIVGNLLDLARAERVQMAPVLLQDVVQKVEEFRAYAAQTQSIRLRCEVATELPFVMGDFHRLVQAVLNLTTNAEYAVLVRREGREITLRAVRAGSRVAVEVEDNGAGVAPEDKEQVFEPFFTTKPRGRGTGLGLSLVRATAEAHGGTARVERAASGGSRFVIELPVANGDFTPPAVGATATGS